MTAEHDAIVVGALCAGSPAARLLRRGPRALSVDEIVTEGGRDVRVLRLPARRRDRGAELAPVPGT